MTGTPTVAEEWLRRQNADMTGTLADHCVLALERALVRGSHEFVRSWPAPPQGDPVPAGSEPEEGFHYVPAVQEIRNRCRHVIDWLITAHIEESPWLKRVDGSGRPLKLLKLGSLDRAYAEADKDMRRIAARYPSPAALKDGDEALEANLAEGWSIVRLLTPAALDMESRLMGHCIGQGAYDEKLDAESIFFSLRDPSGKPHVTIEIDAPMNTIQEIQGKQNKPPIREYAKRLQSFLRDSVQIENRHAQVTRLVVDADGAVHDLDDLPEILNLRSSFVMDGCEGPFPKRIECSSELRIANVEFPDGIVDCEFDVKGQMHLSGGNARHFVRPLSVGRRLSMRDCPVETLHPGTRLGRVLDLRNLPNLETLPTGMFDSIGNNPTNVHIENTGVRSLDGLFASVASLTVVDSPLESLPTDLVVKAETDIKRCPIRVLPGTARFGGNVTVDGPHLELVERNSFGGSLDVSPDMMGRMRDVETPGPVLVMEEGIKVRGVLSLNAVRMPRGLPSDLDAASLWIVGGSYGPGGSGIRIRHDVKLSGGPRKLPDDFTCGGDLVINGGDFEILGRGLRVAGELVAPTGSIVAVEADVEIGRVEARIFSDDVVFEDGLRVGRLENVELLRGRLPEGLVVRGDLDLSGFLPDEVPDRLSVEGGLRLPGTYPSM